MHGWCIWLLKAAKYCENAGNFFPDVLSHSFHNAILHIVLHDTTHLGSCILLVIIAIPYLWGSLSLSNDSIPISPLY
jgi:hypothetical protein